MNFSRATLIALRRALAEAEGDSFVFQGHEIDVRYAKYLIEYLEGQFGVRSAHMSPAEYAQAVIELGDIDELRGAYAFFLHDETLDGRIRAPIVWMLERHVGADVYNLSSDEADAYDTAAEIFGGAPYQRMGAKKHRGPLNGLNPKDPEVYQAEDGDACDACGHPFHQGELMICRTGRVQDGAYCSAKCSASDVPSDAQRFVKRVLDHR